jgi:hypothetical protein
VLAEVISPPPATAAQTQPLTAATVATNKPAATDPRVLRMRFGRSSRHRGSKRLATIASPGDRWPWCAVCRWCGTSASAVTAQAWIDVVINP